MSTKLDAEAEKEFPLIEVKAMFPSDKLYNDRQIGKREAFVKGWLAREQSAQPQPPIMDSEWATKGCREVWAAAGYNDRERAAERFRNGPYQAWSNGWMESRLALVGEGIYAAPVPSQQPSVSVEKIMDVVNAWCDDQPHVGRHSATKQADLRSRLQTLLSK